MGRHNDLRDGFIVFWCDVLGCGKRIVIDTKEQPESALLAHPPGWEARQAWHFCPSCVSSQDSTASAGHAGAGPKRCSVVRPRTGSLNLPALPRRRAHFFAERIVWALLVLALVGILAFVQGRLAQ